MARQMTSSQFHKSKTLDNKYVKPSSSDSEAKEETFVFFFVLTIFDGRCLGMRLAKEHMVEYT